MKAKTPLTLGVVVLLVSPAVAANCPYIHKEACAAPGPSKFLKLWSAKLRCWLCENVTAELTGVGHSIIKGAVASDLGVTDRFEITRPWLGTCLPAYSLAILASTRSINMQSWRLYEFGVSILWNCNYESGHFFRLFGVTPVQIAYVLSSLYQRSEPHPLLLGAQQAERASALHEEFRTSLFRPWDAPLVVDIGMGLGGDTRYYLQQGFRVVAVEANPLAVEAVLLNPKTAPFLQTGQLTVLNAAVSSHDSLQSRVSFYVLPRRPEQSKALPDVVRVDGQEEQADIVLDGGKKVSVRTMRCSDLVKVFGQAVYMKIDVETNTIDCLESLRYEAQARRASGATFDIPRLISMEVEAGDLVARMYDSLLALGYEKYKVCRQFIYSPGPCEQSAYDADVPGCGSGPFGEEAVDYRHGTEWRFLHELVNDTGFLDEFSFGQDWFDIHAKLPD